VELLDEPAARPRVEEHRLRALREMMIPPGKGLLREGVEGAFRRHRDRHLEIERESPCFEGACLRAWQPLPHAGRNGEKKSPRRHGLPEWPASFHHARSFRAGRDPAQWYSGLRREIRGGLLDIVQTEAPGADDLPPPDESAHDAGWQGDDGSADAAGNADPEHD